MAALKHLNKRKEYALWLPIEIGNLVWKVKDLKVEQIPPTHIMFQGNGALRVGVAKQFGLGLSLGLSSSYTFKWYVYFHIKNIYSWIYAKLACLKD